MAYTPIDSIVVDRTLHPDDNVEALAKSILDGGLRFPVLIRAEDRYLVDGLRRLEAAKLAGFTTIEAIEAHTVDDAVEALAASHMDTPAKRTDYPPRRIMEMWRAIIKMPRRASIKDGGKPTRGAFRQALHLSSDNLIQSTVFTYTTAERLDYLGEIARDAVIRMERGEFNGYGGRLRIYRERQHLARADHSMNKTQAHRVITQALANLSATTRGLQLVPPGLEVEAISPETAKDLYNSLEETRRILNSMAGKLYKIAMSEETNE